VKFIAKLQELGLKFIMPAIKNPKVKRLMEKFDAPTIVRYCMESSSDDRKVYFNLFIVEADP